MNIGFSPINNNYAKANNSPSFGMALKIHESAIPIIKGQRIKAGEKAGKKFINTIKEIFERQKNNEVNMEVYPVGKKRLGVLIKDSITGEGFGEYETMVKQSIFSKNGSTKFLTEGEKTADRLHNINREMEDLTQTVNILKNPKTEPNFE